MSAHLFVRQTRFVTATQANRCSGVIVAVETARGSCNRDRAWWDSLTCEKMGFLWLPLPGAWGDIREAIQFLASVGASAVIVNAEPRSPKSKPRWEDGYGPEAMALMDLILAETSRHELELGFTSWARPSARPRFPWRTFMEPADFVIPQPYEVHGRTGRAYVDACLAEYEALTGAPVTWVGRGAHELDKSDSDAWRTPAEIAEHRETTPPGSHEAWWLPAGRLPGSVLDAILANREPGSASTAPAPAPFDRAEIEALAARAKPTDIRAAIELRAAHVRLLKASS